MVPVKHLKVADPILSLDKCVDGIGFSPFTFKIDVVLRDFTDAVLKLIILTDKFSADLYVVTRTQDQFDKTL